METVRRDYWNKTHHRLYASGTEDLEVHCVVTQHVKEHTITMLLSGASIKQEGFHCDVHTVTKQEFAKICIHFVVQGLLTVHCHLSLNFFFIVVSKLLGGYIHSNILV